MGLLLVDGLFREQGSVEWTGLVIIRADGEDPPAFEMRGSVGVTGGVLLYDETGDGARLEITGAAEVLYSREVIDLLRSTLFPSP